MPGMKRRILLVDGEGQSLRELCAELARAGVAGASVIERPELPGAVVITAVAERNGLSGMAGCALPVVRASVAQRAATTNPWAVRTIRGEGKRERGPAAPSLVEGGT